MGFIEISLKIVTYVAVLIRVLGWIAFCFKKRVTISGWLENSRVKMVLDISTKFLIILAILFALLLLTGGADINLETDPGEKIQSLTDPSCIESTTHNSTIEFEWFIDSEEEIDSRVSFSVAPLSSDIITTPFFNESWHEQKMTAGTNEIKNLIFYEEAQKGRYEFCGIIINRVGGQELERACCTASVKLNTQG